jgi:hydrogenase expression/formation protein HypC
MCLGIPGKILDCFESRGLRMAKVEFGGIVREVCRECVPEARAGDYVLVHVGFVISRIDEEEAARTCRLLEEMGQLNELKPSDGESTARST